MAEDADARRHEFKQRAPEMRAALAAELTALLDAAPGLSADEDAVLRHLAAHAGFALSGHFFVPSLATLWGEEASYVAAVPLPPARVRAAVATLRRRGVLAVAGGGGIVVAVEAVRALTAPPLAAPAPAVPPKPKKARVKRAPRAKPAAQRKPRRR